MNQEQPISPVREPYVSHFSVFEGDLVNRGFAKIGIGSRGAVSIIARIIFLISITWLPMALMSLPVDLAADAPASKNFFYDFAAYAQFFIGIPLFVIAERLMNEHLMGAARDFAYSGVVSPEDLPQLKEIEDVVSRARRKTWPELICISLAIIMSLCTIGPELFIHSDMETWHVLKEANGNRTLTAAGAWEMVVALPIQIYWWVRWVWKIMLWYWYLDQVSKFRLVLVASHPDHTGGISFLSEVQAKFAIVILAFGISNIVATIGYKIGIEHAPITLMPVWAPVIGFVIIAPLLFLSPLLLFTKQLHRTKKRALDQFRQRAMLTARNLETGWLYANTSEEDDARARTELSQLNLLTGFYERINHMRVVPFDLRSAAQLVGSAIGPVIPLLPHFFSIPEPWQKAMEVIMKWLPH